MEIWQNTKTPCSKPALPINQQILLHPEALTPSIALRLILGAPWFHTRLFFRVAFQVGELHELVFLHGAIQPRLLPHSRSVDDQVILRKEHAQ